MLFLCVGHGEAKKFLAENDIPATIKIIDLSQDFRWIGEAGKAQTIDATGSPFTYGLPELQRETIQQAQHIANPGCFATGIQLALIPAVAKGWVKDTVQISGITGSTGAGKKLADTSHFSYRTGNMSIGCFKINRYKVIFHSNNLYDY